MNKQLSLLLCYFCFSCAGITKKSDIKKEINDGDVSVDAVLNITRTSYIKGCIEGIKHLTRKESKGVYLEFCKVKAKSHEEDIKSIIK